jgi:hypothetical protein
MFVMPTALAPSNAIVIFSSGIFVLWIVTAFTMSVTNARNSHKPTTATVEAPPAADADTAPSHHVRCMFTVRPYRFVA